MIRSGERQSKLGRVLLLSLIVDILTRRSIVPDFSGKAIGAVMASPNTQSVGHAIQRHGRNALTQGMIKIDSSTCYLPIEIVFNSSLHYEEHQSCTRPDRLLLPSLGFRIAFIIRYVGMGKLDKQA